MITSCHRPHVTTLAALITLVFFTATMINAGSSYAAGNQGGVSGGAPPAGSADFEPAALMAPFPNVFAGSSVSLARGPEGSFGSFAGESPQSLTVDQSTGDVYVVDTKEKRLLRFSSSGAPVDFTAGSGNGTNAIPGLGFQEVPAFDQVAVDSSGGPANGDIYVTQSGSSEIKVFASSGEELGALTGAKTPAGNFGEDCGVAVDQSDGDVYIASYEHRVWRYSPTASPVIEANYSGGIETSIHPCQLAVADGNLYATNWQEPSGAGALERYATSAFVTDPSSSAAATQITARASAVAADPASGDVYADEGNQVSVFGPAGTPLYSFGSGDFGSTSTGVAVAAGGGAYVSDRADHRVDVYATPLASGGRANLGSFGAFSGESPQALTVDQSTGDVYVLDTKGKRLLRYSASGAPVDFTAGPGNGTDAIPGLGVQEYPSFDQVAVDSSNGPAKGDIYITQSGSSEIKVFASSGEELGALTGAKTPAGNFGEDCGVAVDQSTGDLYVASWSNHVWRYSPTGSPVGEGDYSGGIQTSIKPCQLAVAQGSLYAKGWQESPTVGAGGVEKYATSAFVSEPSSPTPATQIATKATAIAADPISDDVYVDEGNQVSVFDPTGTKIYIFGAEDFGSTSTGIAIASSGDAYVSDKTHHQVDIYGPFSAPTPLVQTQAATSVKHVKALLNGHLDPNRGLPITSCTFEWGTDTNYSETPIDCVQGGSFTVPADVSAELAGLIPGTTYHYRLHVTTPENGYSGEDESFETTPQSSTPEVSAGKGAILSSTSTQLEGTIDPNANPLTDCHFEYVTDAAFQTTGFSDLSTGGSVLCDQAPGSIPADYEDHEVTATATGLDPTQIYRYRLVAENANGTGSSTDTLVPGPPIAETTGSPYRTATTARLDSRVIAHSASTIYHFEYTTDADYNANGYSNATSTPIQRVVKNEVQQLRFHYLTSIGYGVSGQFRLNFGGDATGDLPFNATAAEVQAALRALPDIGSPNVAVIGGLDPSNLETDENIYDVTFTGALADTNVASLVIANGTIPLSPLNAAYNSGGLETAIEVEGGPNDLVSLVSQQLTGLDPNTTYHYRAVADNGTPGGPSYGADQTITTRASDAPLTHGRFAGPPGSDRAWEQVSVPDTDGNAVLPLSISDNGERALYYIEGGSPGSTYGGQTVGNSNDQLAERTSSGWQNKSLYPTRAQAPGNIWEGPWGSTELTELYALNRDETNSGNVGVFRMTPGAPAQQIFSTPTEKVLLGSSNFYIASDDGSRMVAILMGTNDPAYPLVQSQEELYDLSSGSPKLIGLLPGNVLPSCGVEPNFMTTAGGSGIPLAQHWLTPDGSHLFFNAYTTTQCEGLFQVGSLYDRNLLNSTTTLIAPHARFIRSAAGAVFFDTTESLVSGDPAGNDIYRYQIDNGNIRCLTCSTPVPVDVETDSNLLSDFNAIAVSDDGSRVYFVSRHRLLAGAADPGIYRLNVASGDLAYVAPATGTRVTAEPSEGGALSPDGSVFVFWSASQELNAMDGQQNGGTAQYYRYDDRDRSLVCVSCPPDGSAPRAAVQPQMTLARGANTAPLTSNGDFFFVTSTPLVSADQNSPALGQNPERGADIYEWRDGRLLLVTDGKTEAKDVPELAGVAPNGRDVFFTQAAALTPDALDTSQRLYDARIGGGFDFPPPPPPCSLEACQGNPLPPPDDATPSSLSFSGPGNQVNSPSVAQPKKKCVRGKCATSQKKWCVKGKVLKHGKCVKKPLRRRAKRSNHNKRSAK